MTNLVLLNAPGPQGPRGLPGPKGDTATSFASNQALVDVIGSFSVGQVLVSSNGNVVVASSTAMTAALAPVGLAISNLAGAANVVTQGLVDPAVNSLGSGLACAVGTDVNGNPVRVIDPTCVSKRKYVGYCDTSGAIYVSPYYTDDLDALDFGADPTGTNLNDVVFAAMLRAATSGDVLRIPAGTYRYATTIDLNNLYGVILKGSAGSHTLVYTGTILQYEGLGDGIRQGKNQQMNAAIRDVIVRCVNPGNQAPQRQSASRVLSGSISSITNSGGLFLVTMTTAHGLATGNLVCIDSTTGTGSLPTFVNDGHTVTVAGATSFTLDGISFTGSYSGGGRVRTRCGAGLVAIQCSQFTWDNVYVTGFGVGFMLDGGQNASIRDCQADGYQGNGGLGSNSKVFQCAIWLTDGDSGCSGFNVQGATNVIVVDTLNTNGCRLGAQIDGCAAVQFRNMRSTNIGAAGLLDTAVTGTTASGGLIQITAAGHGLVTGDFAGLHHVGGTTEANGEWQVTVQDPNHFTLNGSTWINAWTSGGTVQGFAPSAIARINRAESLVFDTCYTEGAGDAHFLFERQTESGSANLSEGVTIRAQFAAGNCPAIIVKGSAYGSHQAVSVAGLVLIGNTWATKQCIGGGQVVKNYIQLGDKFTNDFASGGQTFWDANLATNNGIYSFLNVNTSGFVNGVGFQEPTAHWQINVEDNATSLLRVADLNPAFYWDFFVNARGSTSLKRFVNSPGFGDKAGVEDDLRSASILASSTASAVIATSDAIPVKSNALLEIKVTAHADNDDQTLGSYWIYRVLVGQSASVGTLALITSATLLDSHVGTGFPASLTIGVSGSNVTVTAHANTAQDSTWQTRFEFLTTQRAR